MFCSVGEGFAHVGEQRVLAVERVVAGFDGGDVAGLAVEERDLELPGFGFEGGGGVEVLVEEGDVEVEGTEEKGFEAEFKVRGGGGGGGENSG